MFCKGCGGELREGVCFCPNCGRSVTGVDRKKKSRKMLAAALSFAGAICIGAGLFVVFGLGFIPGNDTYVCTKVVEDAEETDSDGKSYPSSWEYLEYLDLRGNCVKRSLTDNNDHETVFACECSFDSNGYALSSAYEQYFSDGPEKLCFHFQNDIDEQGRIIKSTAKEQHGLILETAYAYFDNSDAIESIDCTCSVDPVSGDGVEYYTSRFGENHIARALPAQIPHNIAEAAILDVTHDKKVQGRSSINFSKEGIVLSLSGNNAYYISYGEPSSLEQRRSQSFSYYREKTNERRETNIEKQWDSNGYISSSFTKLGAFGASSAHSSYRSFTYDHVPFPSHAVSIFSRLHYQ